jgi:hypothetical protein
MGAWSADTFGNDTACDWSYDLEKATDLSLVQKAFEAVLSVADDDLDSDAACEGLAACEVVARLKGNWGLRNPHTETVDKWVEKRTRLRLPRTSFNRHSRSLIVFSLLHQSCSNYGKKATRANGARQ